MNILHCHWVVSWIELAQRIYIVLPHGDVSAVDGISKDLVEVFLYPSETKIGQQTSFIQCLSDHRNGVCRHHSSSQVRFHSSVAG